MRLNKDSLGKECVCVCFIKLWSIIAQHIYLYFMFPFIYSWSVFSHQGLWQLRKRKLLEKTVSVVNIKVVTHEDWEEN